MVMAVGIRPNVRLAKEAGTLVSYDANLRTRLWPLDRARAVIHAAMRLADIALPGIDDAKALTGLEDPDRICDHYLGYGCGMVLLTLGSEGCIAATPEARQRIPALKNERPFALPEIAAPVPVRSVQ